MCLFGRRPALCTQNNALFMRLDSFLERCHDILDLTQTIVQFSKLAKIEVGGTKGNTLTASVKQVFAIVICARSDNFRNMLVNPRPEVSFRLCWGTTRSMSTLQTFLVCLIRLRSTWTSRSLWKNSRVYLTTYWTLQQNRYVVCTGALRRAQQSVGLC